LARRLIAGLVGASKRPLDTEVPLRVSHWLGGVDDRDRDPTIGVTEESTCQPSESPLIAGRTDRGWVTVNVVSWSQMTSPDLEGAKST
jgi:hypothetical protein